MIRKTTYKDNPNRLLHAVCAFGLLISLAALPASAQHVHQLSYTGAWADTNPVGATTDSKTGVAAFLTTPNDQVHTFYLASDDSVHQLFYNGVSWSDENLTSATGAPLALAKSAVSGFSVNNLQYVYYIGSDHHLHQLYYNNSAFADSDLTKISGGPLARSTTKLVAFTQVSNALGTVTPARQIIEGARSVGAKVLLDGAQAVSHMPVDVQSLNPDWYVFSGHKVFAPTGIGVLYGKEELLNEMQPWQGGGNMIQDVTFERTVYQPAPGRFEAGTGSIGDAVGLGAAIDYGSRIGMERIAEYEHQLLLYATRLLKEIPGLRLIGTAPDKAGVLSFVLDGHRTEDVGAALNREGIAVRAGHHCAQPILRRFGVESTVRPSLAFYNTCAEIDALVTALARIAGGRNPVIS